MLSLLKMHNETYSLLCRAGGGPHIEPQYRQYPQITKNQKLQSEVLSGFMWFWILWHLWHNPDAVLVSRISFDTANIISEQILKPPREHAVTYSNQSVLMFLYWYV